MRFTPHITVACVIQKDEHFLIVEEASNQQIVYNQPAGHLEPQETIYQAAEREVLEETGWQVELIGVVGIYFYTAPNNNITYERICFAAKPIQRIKTQIDVDILAVHWFTYAELQQNRAQHRSPMVMQCIDDYRKQHLFPLNLVQHL